MSSCQNCQAPLMPNAKFCSNCGHKVQKVETCHNCQAPKEPNAKFCTQCGTSFDTPSKSLGSSTAHKSPSPPTASPRPPTPPTPPTPGQVQSSKRTQQIPSSKGGHGVSKTSMSYGASRPLSKSSTAVLCVAPVHARGQIEPLFNESEMDIEPLWVESRAALKTVQDAIKSERGGFAAVCLIGPHEDIPHDRISDQTGHDPEVMTDNSYGMNGPISEQMRYTGMGLPEIPVSRIPTLNATMLRRLLVTDDGLCDTWQNGVACSAKVWKRASQAVLDDIAGNSQPPLILTPPHMPGEALNGNVGRFYANVHGSDQSPNWFGDGDGGQPVALIPNNIDVRSGAIAMSEACYGAYIDDPTEAISMRFLNRGAACFVGSTIIAWGPAAPPIGLADLIVSGTYRYLDQGLPLAKALLEAKLDIQEARLNTLHPLTPQEHNTIHSFICYGSPLARVKSAPKSGAASPSTAAFSGTATGRSTGGGSVLGRYRSSVRGSGQGAIGAVRERLRKRLPESSWKALSDTRLSLSDLKQTFRNYDAIQSQLIDILGAPPESLTLKRYKSGYSEHVMLSGSQPAVFGKKCAAVILDKYGKQLAAYVSK